MRVVVAVTLAMIFSAGPAFAAAAKIDRLEIDKSERSLTLFAGGKVIKTYRVALGGNPVGDKEHEGDDRTPEGRYTIDAKNPNSSFYLSLHISYPNAQDKKDARRRGVSPGGQIMIHGTPDYIAALYDAGMYPDWTAGCIAVRNSEIKEIFGLVKTGTPIEIKP